MPSAATASAVEPSPRRSSHTGADSAARVTVARTRARPVIPRWPQPTRVKAMAATVSRMPPRSSSTFCTPGAVASVRGAAAPGATGHTGGI
ncbi:hypothetical protein [Streptomyces geysiriensis]|uniref:hypothetical protein n=1 Tax=Streptomyces geysiriensis TaxID=68207 RepID=UPI001C7CA220|nr:hypothetical protein [Streptomyces geysiriensis]MBX4178772.1 hypothetical protein [Streptomyces geysiriensis]